MKILIIGQDDQMTKIFLSLSKSGVLPNINFTAMDLTTLEFRHQDNLTSYIQSEGFDSVIYCANIADLSITENPANKSEVYKINSVLVRKVAYSCQAFSIPIVYYSSSLVFDGKQSIPYKENIEPNPISTYGQSKYEAEKFLLHQYKHAYIIRPGVVFSQFEPNELTKLILRIRNCDKVLLSFNPTSSFTRGEDLAITTLRILINQARIPFGIYHYSSKECIKQDVFIKMVIDFVMPNDPVEVITRSKDNKHLFREIPNDFSALVPNYSCLDCSKIETSLNMIIPKLYETLKLELLPE